MTRDQPEPEESKSRGKTSRHTDTTSISISKNITAAWLSGPNPDVIHLWIAYYSSCQNNHLEIRTVYQSSCVQCMHLTHYMLLKWSMYCYMYDGACAWREQLNDKWQQYLIFCLTILSSHEHRVAGDSVCVYVCLSGCEYLPDNGRQLPFVSICLASPLSYRLKTPSSFSASITDSSSDTTNRSLEAYQQCQW